MKSRIVVIISVLALLSGLQILNLGCLKGLRDVDKCIGEDCKPDPSKTAIQIESFEPKENAKDVEIDAVIKIKFTKIINTETLAGKITLKLGEESIKGSINYNILEKTLYFEPSEDLKFGKTYSVEVLDGIKDIDGLKLSKAFKWEFTTRLDTWLKTFDSERNSRFFSIRQLKDGNFVVSGAITTEGKNQNALISKIDNNGLIIWSKEISKDGNVASVSALLPQDDDGFLASLVFMNEQDYTYSTFLFKFTKNGDIEWKKILSSNAQQLSFRGIIEADENNILSLTEVNYSSGIAILEKNGTKKLSKLIKAIDGEFRISSISKTNDSNFFGIGRVQTDQDSFSLIFKIDSNGNILWIKKINVENAESVIQTKDNSIYIKGTDKENDSSMGFVIKLNADGTVKWANKIGIQGLVQVIRTMTEMENNNLLLSTKIDPTESLTESVVFKLSSDGKIVWQNKISKLDGYDSDTIMEYEQTVLKNKEIDSYSLGNLLISDHNNIISAGYKQVIPINDSGNTMDEQKGYPVVIKLDLNGDVSMPCPIFNGISLETVDFKDELEITNLNNDYLTVTDFSYEISDAPEVSIKNYKLEEEMICPVE